MKHTTQNKVKVVETMVEYVYESQLLGILIKKRNYKVLKN